MPSSQQSEELLYVERGGGKQWLCKRIGNKDRKQGREGGREVASQDNRLGGHD